MWFKFLTCLCVAVVVADRKTCQKVQLNNGRIRGECCIFTKETPKEELLGLLDLKLTTEMMLQHEKLQGADIFFPGIGPIPEFEPQGPTTTAINIPLKEYPGMEAASGEVTSQEKDDRSTEVISTTTIETAATEVSNSNNTGITGKTILDNRNAIDVPIVSCPPGQARSPSGDCIEEY